MLNLYRESFDCREVHGQIRARNVNGRPLSLSAPHGAKASEPSVASPPSWPHKRLASRRTSGAHRLLRGASSEVRLILHLHLTGTENRMKIDRLKILLYYELNINKIILNKNRLNHNKSIEFYFREAQVGWDTPPAVHANEASIVRYEARRKGFQSK